MTEQVTTPGVPFPLAASPAGRWRVEPATGTLTGSAAPGTDLFIDPGSGAATLDATSLLGLPPAGDFQLSARVTVAFGATYDAGVLLLWADERRWGKLCFERSPAGEPMIVSVVCRELADDANAFVVAGESVWLRVSRIDRAYAYHASVDGKTWQLIRYFALGEGGTDVRIGFEAQSPTGDGCQVRFDQLRFVPARLADLRDGT